MQLPLDYYTLRTRRALERLEALGKAQAMLVSLSENVAYLSGFAGGDSWLVIGAGGGRWLVTDSRYAEQAAGQAKDYRVVLRDGSTVFETLKSLLL
ncbi:MAG: aminopeptidase P family N-terminal domain-containing protein, partial [Candidatus Omnitrophota bacterium]